MLNSSMLSRRALLLGTAAVATAAAVPAVAAIEAPAKVWSAKESFYAFAYGMQVDRIELPGYQAGPTAPFTVHMRGADGVTGSFSSAEYKTILPMMRRVFERKQTLTIGARDVGPNARQLGFIIEDERAT
jgi:hypothetical protein